MHLLKRSHSNGHGGHEITRTGSHPGSGEWGLPRLYQEVNQFFERLRRQMIGGQALASSGPVLENWPAIDMSEDEKALTIRADVPGLDAKDLDVEVSGERLTIRGSREDEMSENRGGVYFRERRSGSFSRTLTLPAYANVEELNAKYEKGTLTITVPKMPGQETKRVQIKG